MCAWAASIPAHAQTATCDGRATFDTFVPSSGTYTIASGGSTGVDDYDLSGSLADAFAGRSSADLNSNSAALVASGGMRSFADQFDNGIPLFFSGATATRRPEPGDLLRLSGILATDDPAITLRVYTRADGMLALTPHLTVGIADTCADGLTGDQFFLDEDWAETKTADANNQGYAAPDCASANRMAGDLMCGGCLANFVENSAGMCVAVPTCGVDMRLDAAANECVACDAGMVSGASEQNCRMPMSDAECMRVNANLPIWDGDGNMCVAAATPMPDPTPPNCTGNNRINDAGDGCIPCGDGMRPTSDRMMCEAIPPTPAPSPTPAPTPQPTPPAASQAAEDADWATAGGIVGGIMGLVFAVHYLGGEADAFSFNPDFGYAISESGYSYKYGGRLDLIKDAWSLYMSAGQRNSDGDWGDLRYESGGEYDGGFWRASFSESVAGDITDYDFSLSADWNGGIWRLSPEFFADARYEDGEFAVENSFRISGELRVDDWRLSADGDAERVRLSAVRKF